MPTIIDRVETAFAGWLTVLRVRLTAGTAEFEREVEHHGNGAAVFPYDPDRRVALVIRQTRAPVLLAGEAPLIEAPAGLVETGEDPGEAVRREGLEEAGVRLDRLEACGVVWTMPGISTERMHMFLAPYGAADRMGPGGGLADEHEDIVVEEIPLDELARLADANALPDIRTMFLLTTLRLRHPALFAPRG